MSGSDVEPVGKQGDESESDLKATETRGKGSPESPAVCDAESTSSRVIDQAQPAPSQEPSPLEELPPEGQSESTESSVNVPSSESGEVERPIISGRDTLTQIHLSKILDEVLEEPVGAGVGQSTTGGKRFPLVIIELLLGLGLLVAVGGFVIGMLHMYVVHSAQQCINQEDYERAIVILRGAPVPELFCLPGSEAEEMLNQALYMEGLQRIKEGDKAAGIRRLQEVRAGSRFFINAHKLIGESDEPASIMLEGGTEKIETNPLPAREGKKTQLQKVLSGEDQD